MPTFGFQSPGDVLGIGCYNKSESAIVILMPPRIWSDKCQQNKQKVLAIMNQLQVAVKVSNKMSTYKQSVWFLVQHVDFSSNRLLPSCKTQNQYLTSNHTSQACCCLQCLEHFKSCITASISNVIFLKGFNASPQSTWYTLTCFQTLTSKALIMGQSPKPK